jgi:hypothetical protein
MSSVHANVAIAPEALEAVQTGTVFEKTAIGWNVKWVEGGTVVHLQGTTITEALGSHGAQVVHIEPEIRPDPRAPDAPVDRRADDDEQVFALSAAEIAGTLPDVDRRDEGAE